MECTLFLVADYALVSQDGKLSIMGIFDSIQSSGFPAAHPRMHLVAQFRAPEREYGAEFKLNFQLLDENGDAIVNMNGQGEVPYSDTGRPVQMNQVVTLNNVTFQKHGTYTFACRVNDETLATMPFHVIKTRKPSNEI